MDKLGLAFLIAVLFCASCKKEADVEPTAINVQKLKQAYYYDSTILLTGGVNDTIIALYKDSFGYDNKSRLINRYQSRKSYKPSGLLVTPLTTSQTQFYYSSNTAKPANYVTDGTIHELSYDQQLKLLRDSILYPVAGNPAKNHVVTFSYLANSILQKDSGMTATGKLVFKDELTLQNDNIMSQHSTGLVTWDFSFTYSSVINPYYDLNFNNIFSLTSALYDTDPVRINSKNVRSSIKVGANSFPMVLTTDASGRLIKMLDTYRNKTFYFDFY